MPGGSATYLVPGEQQKAGANLAYNTTYFDITEMIEGNADLSQIVLWSE